MFSFPVVESFIKASVEVIHIGRHGQEPGPLATYTEGPHWNPQSYVGSSRFCRACWEHFRLWGYPPHTHTHFRVPVGKVNEGSQTKARIY